MHYGRCLVSLLLLTDRILFTDYYYVTILHTHFMVTVLVRFIIGITIHQEYVFFHTLLQMWGEKLCIPSTNNSSLVIYLVHPYIISVFPIRLYTLSVFKSCLYSGEEENHNCPTYVPAHSWISSVDSADAHLGR